MAETPFERLVEIMRVLRSPDGCPWDREQTPESLRPFVLEEAYEVVDAIDSGNRERLMAEIGDLIFEGVFLAQLCAEDGDFTVEDALHTVNEKLVRRHPHVFGPGGSASDQPAAGRTSSEQVVEQWERIKARERTESGEPPRTLGDIPRALPGLLRAFQMGKRAASAGFDWPTAAGVVDKIEEEVAEVRHALARADDRHIEEEVGDLLFAIANLSRKLGVEPEGALRRANDKFSTRFDQLEARARARGRSLNQEGLEELEREWTRIKESGG